MAEQPSAFGPDINWSLTKEVVDRAHRDLRNWHDRIARMVRQYAGADVHDQYGDVDRVSGVANNRTLNALGVLIETYMQNLVAGRPQARVTSADAALRMQSRLFQLALNRVMEQVGLQKTLEAGVLDAIFGMGIVKTGIVLADSDLYGSQFRYSALPYAEPVLVTDYVYDIDASRWDRLRWEGDIYEMPLGDIEMDDRNDPEVVAMCQPGVRALNEFQELEDSLIGRESVIPGTDSDMVRLVDIYLPRERMIATFPLDGTKPLRVQNYIGPPSGPYHKLIFHPVPGRTRPIAPAEFAAPMADLMSLMFQDMGMQASRRKTLLLVNTQGPGEVDAARINQARDGEAVPVNDPSSCQERSYGGVDGAAVQFVQVLREWFSWSNGNLDVAGGLASGAQTLGQEKLLAATSSARINRMQHKVTEWTRGIMGAIGWYLWHDPECRVKTIDKIANTNTELSFEFPVIEMATGEQQDVRMGHSFQSFAFHIEPFSLTPQSPAQKIQQIRQIMQEILPMAQMLAESGTTLDLAQYIKLLAELGDMPELLEVVRVQPPDPASASGPKFDKPPKPSTTTRTYERVRGGGPTPGGAARAAAMGMPQSREDR